MKSSDNLTKGLKILGLKYAQNPTIAQMMSQIASNIDVLIISGMKTDDSFPTSQFLIDDFSSTYRLDKNVNRGYALAYFKNNIVTK